MADTDARAIEGTVETTTHGRYLVSPAKVQGGPLLIGFHGYGETAEEELDRLRRIPGTDHWIMGSVQGLHQFYRRRTDDIVASWMTRQNRDLSITDNQKYVSQVIHRVFEDYGVGKPLVLTGFSQGAGMAYRAASTLDQPVSGVMVCGGDVPPELDAGRLARIPAVLIGRGRNDEWYTAEKMESDEGRLRAAGVKVTTLTFEAGHEWTPVFNDACLKFLSRVSLQEI